MQRVRRISLVAWSVAAAFVLATVAAASLLINRGYDSALHHGRDRVTHSVATAEAEINRTLLTVDVLIAGMEELVRRTMGQLRRQMFDYGIGFSAYCVKHACDLEIGFLISQPSQPFFPFRDFKRLPAQHSAWTNHQRQSSRARESRDQVVLWQP